MSEAIKGLGIMVGIVIALTLIGGGAFTLGTGATGPFASFGFTGPYRKG